MNVNQIRKITARKTLSSQLPVMRFALFAAVACGAFLLLRLAALTMIEPFPAYAAFWSTISGWGIRILFAVTAVFCIHLARLSLRRFDRSIWFNHGVLFLMLAFIRVPELAALIDQAFDAVRAGSGPAFVFLTLVTALLVMHAVFLTAILGETPGSGWLMAVGLSLVGAAFVAGVVGSGRPYPAFAWAWEVAFYDVCLFLGSISVMGSMLTHDRFLGEQNLRVRHGIARRYPDVAGIDARDRGFVAAPAGADSRYGMEDSPYRD